MSGKSGADRQERGPDLRLDTPAFHRNHRPIAEVLARHLGRADGHVIEIGSGSGQHVAAFARLSALDLVADRHRSAASGQHRWLAAAVRDGEPARRRPAGCRPDWGLGSPGRPPSTDIAAVVAVNVIHIAPWAVAEGLVAGAGACLAGGGLLILYGPFARGGVHTAPSNEAFDTYLRHENPDWGVRDLQDVETLAEAAGLQLKVVVEMPANNLTVLFGKPR